MEENQISSPSSVRDDIQLTFDRQLDIFNPNNYKNVTVVFVGVGTIGSYAALLTAKLGLKNIVLVDDDTVEIHNASNQLPGTKYIGMPKVDAVGSIIKDLCAIECVKINSKFPIEYTVMREFMGTDFILVCGVDSMSARKEIFEWLKSNARYVNLYIDGRTASEATRVFCVDPKSDSDMESYAGTLYSDDSSAIENETARALSDVKCTARSIADVSAYMGVRIANCIRKTLLLQPVKSEYVADITNDIWATD